MAAYPPDRLKSIFNVMSFLTAANALPLVSAVPIPLVSPNSVPRLSEAQTSTDDPMVMVLRGLVATSGSLPELVEETGMGLSELTPMLEKLVSMRLVRRTDADSRIVFSIEDDGRKLLEATT